VDKLREIIKELILQEYEKITQKNVADNVKFWALYSASFYERLFQKINNKKSLDKVYDIMLSKLKRVDAKKALNFFYRLRKQELEGTFKWEHKMDRLRQIIREEIKSILSEKNIKTQKWRKIPEYEWTPKGLSNKTKVKSGNYVTGYLDGMELYVQIGSSEELTKTSVRNEMEADRILFKLEDNKGK